MREGIKPRKNKPTSKAFTEFESKGILIGFVSLLRLRPELLNYIFLLFFFHFEHDNSVTEICSIEIDMQPLKWKIQIVNTDLNLQFRLSAHFLVTNISRSRMFCLGLALSDSC